MVLSGAVLIGFGPRGLAGISLIRVMVDERDKKQYNVRCGCAIGCTTQVAGFGKSDPVSRILRPNPEL
jgi:hypothetical protein